MADDAVEERLAQLERGLANLARGLQAAVGHSRRLTSDFRASKPT